MPQAELKDLTHGWIVAMGQHPDDSVYVIFCHPDRPPMKFDFERGELVELKHEPPETGLPKRDLSEM